MPNYTFLDSGNICTCCNRPRHVCIAELEKSYQDLEKQAVQVEGTPDYTPCEVCNKYSFNCTCTTKGKE